MATDHPYVNKRTPGELTGREVEVLGMYAAGQSLPAIATELYLSVNTLKTHLRRTMLALGATSRADAVAIAVTRGLITLPPALDLQET